MHCFKLCVCCYLCSSGVKGLFLPWDAVLYDFLSDQAEPLLNLLQLSPHLLRQRRRVLSLEDEQRDVFIWPQWECYFSHTVQSFMYVECLNVCLGITEHTQNVITGINLLHSTLLWLITTKQCLTLRLFMSKACVRSANSLSAVPMVPCRRRSFSSSFLTTCSWASTW